MNFLDLLPDDVIENINFHLSKLDIKEKRREKKKKKKFKNKIKKYFNILKYVKKC